MQVMIKYAREARRGTDEGRELGAVIFKTEIKVLRTNALLYYLFSQLLVLPLFEQGKIVEKGKIELSCKALLFL